MGETPERSANGTGTITATEALTAVAVGGGIAGGLDLAYAMIFNGVAYGLPPLRVMQSIASGLLGKASYQGGAATAALGVALHFFIACAWCALYLLASRKLRLLVERPILCGALFGLLVYGVMYLVVLPLSAFPHAVSFGGLGFATGVAAHMFLVGLPVALAVRRFAK